MKYAYIDRIYLFEELNTNNVQIKTHTKKVTRRKIPAGKRWDVFNKYENSCFYCGRKAGNGVELHIDHKISLHDGGTNDFDNLVSACSECNLGKGKRSSLV